MTDGTSQTILMGEAKAHFNDCGSLFAINVPANGFWLKPNSQFLYARQLANTAGWQDGAGFGSYHVGGTHFLFSDGAVRFINDAIDYTTYSYLGTMADNQAISQADLGG